MNISNIKLKIVFGFTLFGLISIPIKNRAMKRLNDEQNALPPKRDKKEAWMSPAQTKIDLALESTTNKLLPADPDVEIVHIDSFNCRHYGQDECVYKFTHEEDMCRHILKYHNIVPARHFSE